jgi:hypothetical protein
MRIRRRRARVCTTREGSVSSADVSGGLRSASGCPVLLGGGAVRAGQVRWILLLSSSSARACRDGIGQCLVAGAMSTREGDAEVGGFVCHGSPKIAASRLHHAQESTVGSVQAGRSNGSR